MAPVLFLALAACSTQSGTWPNLAEPYPDPNERNRVIERANPVEPTLVHDESPLTRSTAFKLLESTRARLETATAEYLSVKSKLDAATGEDRTDYWNEAQLSLTRLSHTASRLDTIIASDKLMDAPVWDKTRLLKIEKDKFLVAEREALAALKP